MSETVLSRNYSVVLKNFLSYLPSRLIVIFNALFIVPIFAYFLTAQEMSVFQISIGILNFVCTVSTDWVAKSVLRFYEKYRQINETDKFFSSIAFIELVLLALVFAFYFIFKELIAEKFYISNRIFLITLILVVPCGIRQMLYQMLRLCRKSFLYTVSIVIYQISLLLLFFAFSIFAENVISILMAMTFGICLIDFIILLKIKMKENVNFKIDKEILKNILIYAIPMLLTNVCIWLILHFGKFVFQINKDFVSTAVVGTAWYFVTSILTPLFSLLMFAVFPVIIKRFEKNYKIKEFMSAVLNSYIIIFLPFVFVFIFYFFEIAKFAFKSEYNNIGILFPFCAVTVFIHELMKLMNTKYHLKNKTYIETFISVITAIVCVVLNIILIKYFGILGFGIAMVISVVLLYLANSLVKFKYLDYVFPKKIFKCTLKSVLCAIISYAIIFPVFFKLQYTGVIIFKIIAFLSLYYLIIQKFKKHIFV